MKTTRTNRASKAARKARLDNITEGLRCEVAAFSQAIRDGREVRFPVRESSLASGRRVESARYGYDGLWVTCAAYGGSFCLGNDGRWAELLRIAGVKRDVRAKG